MQLPKPLFNPRTRISTTPPAVSPSFFSAATFSSAALSASGSSIPRPVFFASESASNAYLPPSFMPHTSRTYPAISTPSAERYCRNTPPAATRIAVSRAEARSRILRASS